MKHLASILILIAAFAVNAFSQSQTNAITLSCNYNPPDDITNYVFLFRSTNTPAAPLPWPVIASVTGGTQVAISCPMTNWETRFFYVTVTDSRSSPTNYVGESPPSNTVTSRVIPGVTGMTIQKGP